MREMFCDWVSLSGTVRPGCAWPIIADGHTWRIDRDLHVVLETAHRFPVVASYDTSVRLRCDGRRLELDGNIGRLGRPDNVTGYTVAECFDLCMALLRTLGVDPDLGQPYTVHPSRSSAVGPSVEGWRFRRIDWTTLFATGSDTESDLVMRRWARVSLEGRARLPVMDGGTIYWAKTSSFWSMKAYQKYREVLQHGGEWPAYAPRHVVRLEAVMRQKVLCRYGWDNPETWSKPVEQLIWFERVCAPILGESVDMELESPNLRLRGAFSLWERGQLSPLNYSRATWTRLKRQMKDAYGVDISLPPNADYSLPVPVRVIELQPLKLRHLAPLPGPAAFAGVTYQKAA